MKKLFSFIFGLCVTVMMIQAQTITAPTLGDGSSGSPYQIATINNLYWLSQTSSVWGKYFIQTADINASVTSTWTGGFPPIANGSNFKGNYNGQGHIISGLYITKSSEHTGLFFCPDNATISNLGLTDCNIQGGANYVGALASAIFSSTQIKNCFVTGSVEGTVDFVGGLVGLNQNSSISNCYFVGTVSARYFAGGIVGLNRSSTITNCYVSATISGKSDYPQYTGGVYGYMEEEGSANNCFYNSDSSTVTTGYGTGKTTAEMKTQSTFTNAGWDFAGETANGTNDYWALSTGINSGYPCFVWQGTLTAPTVTTQAVSDIIGSTATGNGNITDLGFPNPTSYGVCWNTTGTPTISDSKVDNGAASATGAFIASMEDLSINTTYYARAYATNAKSTSYGNEVTFTTSGIATSDVTNITSTGATLNGIINANNISSTVTFEYGTSTGFGTSVSATPGTVTGNSTTNVSYALSGLTPNTTYYVRVVATKTGGGTVYGNTVSFSTKLIGGIGSVADPYQITSLVDLKWLSENSSYWGSYFIQTANIDASGTSSWNSGSGFSPIGNSTTKFTGQYNGNGHTITNLTISRSTTDYIGMFGYIGSGATVTSLGVTATAITGQNYVGILAGYNSGTISSCNTGGSVTGGISVGGFIGTNSGGTISKSYSTAATIGNNDVAAFVGDNVSNGSISNCYATGNSNGGTSGSNYTSGGLVGWNGSGSTITNCYATGYATGYDHIGGLVGSSGGTINNSFYNKDVFTGSTSYGTGKNTAEMKMAGTFINAGWNFAKAENSWAINETDNSGYPYLRYQAYPSSDIWLGTSTTEWSTAANWSEESVPASATNVIVPNVTNDPVMSPTATADCNNLTVETAGNLTIQSSVAGTGSLIIHGTSSGTVTAELYMTKDAWHIISPTASGQTVAGFLTANTNIPEKSGNRGMMDYNTLENKWNSYYPNTGASGSMDTGKGFSARISTTDGTVTFTGTLTSGNTTVSLSNAGDGWNCVGNPYPSAIKMNDVVDDSNNFLRANAITASNLDGSYACVYVWDDTNSSYKILNNAGNGDRSLGQNIIQSGQGFFVKAASAASSINFTPALQLHSSGTALKSAEATWPGFELMATSSNVKAATVVTFNPNMTTGLDVTYDAGLLRGTSGVSLYTHLVDDNGVDFAIQCLPEDGMENFVVPVGLDTKAGGEVKFSATTTGLPTGSSVILEDRTAKVYTDLSNNGEYAVTLSANSSGTGRFYIHTSYLTTGTSDLLPTEGFSLKAYPANGVIWIEGSVSSSAKAYLFSIGGSKLGAFNLQEGNHNSIPASGLVTGVYLLKVTDGSNQFNTKIVIYK